MRYLALCCIAKDEEPFLKEWIAYHSLLGVEHFYIYDNESKRPIREVLDGFTDAGRVTIRRITGHTMQLLAYADCLESFGKDCHWIGFLDIDEFALPVQENDLRVFLSEFEQYGGLAAPWHLFNSSGHLRRPEGPVIKNYVEAFRPSESFQNKCFVQPARARQPFNPHFFNYIDGYYCANEDHYPVSPFCEPSFSSGSRIRVNHYFVRSQQDFEEKLKRGRGDTAALDRQHDWTMFNEAIKHPYAEDRTIQRFLPRLEAILEAGRLPEVSPLLPQGADYEALMEGALKLMEAGEPEKAQALMCYAGPEHRAKADFWTLRAMLAMEAGQPERADLFIRQSMIREATLTGYKQLETQFRVMGKSELADNVRNITTRYSSYFH